MEYAIPEPAHLKIWAMGMGCTIGIETVGLCFVFYQNISQKLEKHILEGVYDIQKDRTLALMIADKIIAEKAAELRGRFWKNMIRYVFIQNRFQSVFLGTNLALVLGSILRKVGRSEDVAWGLCSPFGFNRPMLRLPSELSEQIPSMTRSDRVLRSMSISCFSLLEYISVIGSFLWKGATGQGNGLVKPASLHVFLMSTTYIVADAVAAFCSASPWLSWAVSFGIRLVCHPQPYHAEFMKLCNMLLPYEDTKCDSFLYEELEKMNFELLVKTHSRDVKFPPQDVLRHILQNGALQQPLPSEQPAPAEVNPHFADLD